MSHPAPPTTAPPPLTLRGVGHDHGRVVALDGIDLDVAAGSFVAVVGPSGCGKSTLLRLVAGLDRPTRGRIAIGDHDPAEVRRAKQVGWLAQRPALLPWATVRDNVALAREIVATPRSAPDLDPLLDLVSLGDFADALPGQLSGGMQQRAALARMLAQDAPLWLMDEPLAALDELTREGLAADLLGIWERLRPTVVWVTHHLTEAVSLADRVVVLGPRPGTVVGDLEVDLPRPRDVTAPAVQDLVREARHLLGSVDEVTVATSDLAPRRVAGAGPGARA
ncbi:ABC transporter ATP-binding protein [Salsipaludibacter albus]|uniref:ABC transporter ATP-binding protein n=1 Tax=Salsipaludibacter albus TaxID=2849650 RepID=UPI001EE4D9F1|nr:ABC transporter ATP-binding protein [Salsipaludibacter albus]MBY5162495.1 ABC transporter ATP-binding protein [Salsipaludibacter albus]